MPNRSKSVHGRILEAVAGMQVNVRKGLKIILKCLFFYLLVILLSLLINFSIHHAKGKKTGDFAAFYCAGIIAIDPTIKNYGMYDQAQINIVAESRSIDATPERYLYSVPIAYLFSPLSFFTYNDAKIIFNSTNIILYIAAILMLVKSTKRLWFVLTFSLIWAPLYYNQEWLQSNTILLLLIASAILSAEINKPILSGALLGVAALIKVFPIAIAVVFAIKNPRVLLSCLTIICLSLILPGSVEWFSAIAGGHHQNYTDVYAALKQLGYFWYVLYVCVVTSVTFYVVYLARHESYQLLASLSVPAMLLVSPIVGGYYLVLLMISYIYIVINFDLNQKWVGGFAALSYFMINYTLVTSDTFAFGLFILWATLIFSTYKKCQKVHPRVSLINGV